MNVACLVQGEPKVQGQSQEGLVHLARWQDQRSRRESPPQQLEVHLRNVSPIWFDIRDSLTSSGPSWTFDEGSQQWYCHTFLKEQPG
jgi:hypothetical protein